MTDAVARFRDSVRELEAIDPDAPVRDELPGYRAAHPEYAAVRVAEVRIKGSAVVPARLMSPPGVAQAAFVWVHGGSFVGGDLGMAESWWPALALAARGVAVLAVDYRKALRGTRFPAPSDDVLAAWRWASAAPELVGPARSIPLSLGGASAGGGLAAGAAARALEEGDPTPASVVLVYPTLHSRAAEQSSELRRTLDGQPGEVRFPSELVVEMGRNLVGDGPVLRHAFPGDDPVDPRLPPTLVIDSEADDLRASGEAYGRSLARAGVPVRVETEPGTVHGHLDRPDEPGALRTIDRIADWLLAPHLREEPRP